MRIKVDIGPFVDTETAQAAAVLLAITRALPPGSVPVVTSITDDEAPVAEAAPA
jgi:hypothetical protein